jgi:pyruvate,water dikinase
MDGARTIVPLRECEDRALCGGKAINLGRLLRAGLPVPDGFVITTAAFRQAITGRRERLPAALATEIAAACRRLGESAVAVRSSATVEDLPRTSLAGQFATFLNVRGQQAVLEAVQRCWQSVRTPHVQSYLDAHGIAADSVQMAVIVQQLAPAEVAGVLFTADPQTGAADRMLVEAAWGLGETVVSGAVQPDTVVLDRTSGQEQVYTIGDKSVWLPAGPGGRQRVDPARRHARCLQPGQLHELWELARRVVQCCQAEQDIEWALVDGLPVLLQTRAITALPTPETTEVWLEQTRARLRQLKAQGRGDWARHNLAETLPHPTPLTWSVIRRFMSGCGGFGQLYRLAGFQSAERACAEGCLELIGGRIYTDLSLAPEMFGHAFPFRYDPDLLRSHPEAAQQLPTLPAGSWLQRARTLGHVAAVQRTLLAQAADCDRRLRDDLLSDFADWVHREKQRDLTALSAEQWCEIWQDRQRRVLDQLGPDVLLPSMIAAMAIERLRVFLEQHFWDDDPHQLLRELAVGGTADSTIQANEALRSLADDPSAVDRWLERYGHRGPEEFDLAAMRWRERPQEVQQLAARLAAGPSPLAMYQQRLAGARRCAESLRSRLPARHRRQFDDQLALVQRYLPWREDGKAALLLGYDLLRDLALEAARRLALDSDVFLLTLDELQQALRMHEDPAAAGRLPGDGNGVAELIRQRHRQRSGEGAVSLPLLIDEQAIERLDQPPQQADAGSLKTLPLSTGTGTGPVRILRSVGGANDLGQGYVLVCPNTDPSWTALFVQAAGLVLECGGVLSHGAVVARELGIPAVVLPRATELLREGERVTVDAGRGLIVREAARDTAQQPVEPDARDV